MKKKLFSTILVFSMIMGVAFSYTPQAAEADVIMHEEDKIPCWNQWTINPTFRFIYCPTCTAQTGKPVGDKQWQCY